MAEEQNVNLDFLNNKEAGKAFNEAEEISPGGVPHGVYVAEIIETGIKESKAGNPQVVLNLSVAQGPYLGRFLPSIYTPLPIMKYDEKGKLIESESDDFPIQKEKWGRLKGKLAYCGVALNSRPELPKALEKLEGRFLQVKTSPQKDNPEYSNVNIQKYVEKLEDVEGEDAPAF